MEKVRLGKTGMMVTKLGFGGIPIQRVSEAGAIQVVRRCLDLGINFIDTANGYGTSEERIGKAIAGRRHEVVIATKSLDRTAKGIQNHLELSLKRLRTSFIDLYQIHNVCTHSALEQVLTEHGPLASVKKAKTDGVIKHIGVTTHSIDIAKVLVESGHFETIMVPFNVISTEAIRELMPLAKEHDVGFIAMKPLEGGRLTNVSLAFKYLFQFPDVVSVVGVESPREIEEIVEVSRHDCTISDGERLKIERLRHELGNRFCRRCDYCQPCSQGINIAMVMSYDIELRTQPPEKVFSGWYAGVMETAMNCTNCGECVERCPYGLPIPDMIAGYVERYREDRKEYK